MVNVLAIVLISFAVMVLGGGGFYLFWLFTRPKKITWQANVYQIGEGVKPPIKNKKGVILSEIKLNDLRPYTKDVIEKIEKKGGVAYYHLAKLGKTVPPVTSDVVEFWGEKQKFVDVLIHEDTCTLLKKGYDGKAGQEIFTPLPHSRINQIKSEILIRKERLQEKKDILQAITPWIVTGISIMGLVAMTYFVAQAAIEMTENIKAAQIYAADRSVEVAGIYRDSLMGVFPDKQLVKEEEPPPLVE